MTIFGSGGHVDEPLRGRDPLLRSVAELLDSSDPHTVLLHGGGGYGKSKAALAIATCATQRTVLWVAGHDRDRLESGMRAAAQQLLPTSQAFAGQWDATKPALSFWQILDSFEGKWLLVLDNIDDPAILRPTSDRLGDVSWLRPPTTSDGFVLVTSRDPTSSEWGVHASFGIGPLKDDEGAQVLFDAAGPAIGTRRQAAALSKRLGGFPLALSIAGAHLRRAAEDDEDSATAEAYESSWTARRREVHADGFSRAEAVLAHVTSELSLDLLAAQDRPQGTTGHERPLLQLFAAMDAAPIPTTSLRLGPAGAALFGNATDDDVARTTETLIRMGLVEPVTESMDSSRLLDRDDRNAPRRLSSGLHDLMREAVRAAPDFAQVGDDIALAMSEMADLAVGTLEPEDRKSWPTWESWAPHLAEILRFCALHTQLVPEHPATLRAAVLARQGAWYLHRSGRHHQAEFEMREVLDVYEQVFGPDDQLTVDATIDLARIVRDAGNWAAAESLFVTVESIQSRHGTDSDELIRTRNRLANVRRLRGHVAIAVEGFDEVIDAQVAALAHTPGVERELDLLSTRLNRALALRGSAEAEAELRTVVTERQRLLSDEHLETLHARNQLAVLLRDKWRVAEALTEFQAIEVLRTRALGPEHRDVLSTRNQLSGTLYRMRRFDEAIANWADVLEIRKRVLGPSHPYTMIVMQHLGRADLEKADRAPELRHELLDTADDQLRELEERQLRKYRGENDQVWGTQVLLARVLLARGRAEEAGEQLDAVHAKQVAGLGMRHQWTLETRFRLAEAKRALGDTSGAREHAQFVLREREHQLAEGAGDIEDVRRFLEDLEQGRSDTEETGGRPRDD